MESHSPACRAGDILRSRHVLAHRVRPDAGEKSHLTVSGHFRSEGFQQVEHAPPHAHKSEDSAHDHTDGGPRRCEDSCRLDMFIGNIQMRRHAVPQAMGNTPAALTMPAFLRLQETVDINFRSEPYGDTALTCKAAKSVGTSTVAFHCARSAVAPSTGVILTIIA